MLYAAISNLHVMRACACLELFHTEAFPYNDQRHCGEVTVDPSPQPCQWAPVSLC